MSGGDIKFAALILLFAIFLLGNGNARSVTFLSAEVSFNPIYNSVNKVVINNGSIDAIINVAQNYPRDMWAVVDIAQKDSNLDTYNTRLQYDFNVCALFRKGSSKIITDVMSSIFKQGNMPIQCPILKGNYSWTLKPELFIVPPFAPVNKFRLRYNNYFRQRSGRDHIANTSVFFKINK